MKYQLWIECPKCGKKFLTETQDSECPFCGAKLRVKVKIEISEVQRRETPTRRFPKTTLQKMGSTPPDCTHKRN